MTPDKLNKGESPPPAPPDAGEASTLFARQARNDLFARQARMAFGLLQNAIEEAADTVESQNEKLAAELEALQARALRSIHDSAMATIELMEAIGAARTPGEIADRQIDFARRGRATAQDSMGDFLASARAMVEMIADPMNRQMSALSSAVLPERGPADSVESIVERLNSLTARQKKVLALLAEGLPNKVIAHRLGISETTVKAHVGEILRKLKVYNRARAIVLLAQFDLRPFLDLPAPDGGEAQ
jgi:DNA-binding NarL/FixJ family response regulator